MLPGRASLISLVLCSLSLLATSQETRIVRVGVATMKNAAGRSVPGELQRDRLVSDLNQQKPDKKTRMTLQAVPLDGTTRDEVADQAKQKKVDYVVLTTLTQLSMSSDPMQRMPGTIQTNPNNIGMPGRSPGSLNQTYEATVDYRLYRADGSAVSGGPYSVNQGVSDDAAVSQAIDRVAMKIAGDLKKAGPPPPMQE